MTTINKDDITKFLAKVDEQPWQLRHLRTHINHALGRPTNSRLGDVCIEYYNSLNYIDRPKGVLLQEDIRSDWASCVQVLRPERRFQRPAPICLTDEIPSALGAAFRNAAHLAVEFYESETAHYNIRFTHDLPIVAKIIDGRPVALTKLSTPNCDALNIKGGESAYHEAPFKISPVAITFDEYVGNNYCHWLLDWLPRFLFLQRIDVDLTKYNFIFSRPLARFIVETLNIIGVDQSQIIQFNSRDHNVVSCIALDRFVGLSSSGTGFRHALNGGDSDYVDLIRSRLRPSNNHRSTFPKIIVNRLSNRRLFFDDAAISTLEDSGFREVFLENASLQEQIDLFSGADHILSAHGAALANIVFCRHGTKVLEIFPQNYSTSAFATVAYACGLDYRCAVVPRHGFPKGGHVRDDDLAVSARIVKDWLS